MYAKGGGHILPRLWRDTPEFLLASSCGVLTDGKSGSVSPNAQQDFESHYFIHASNCISKQLQGLYEYLLHGFGECIQARDGDTSYCQGVRIPPRRSGFDPQWVSLMDFGTWKSCWTMLLASGLSWGAPVSPALVLQYRSILGSHAMSTDDGQLWVTCISRKKMHWPTAPDILTEQFDENSTDLRLLVWAPRSPDPSPVEHLWDLSTGIAAIMNLYGSRLLSVFVKSMPCHVTESIKAKTGYCNQCLHQVELYVRRPGNGTSQTVAHETVQLRSIEKQLLRAMENWGCGDLGRQFVFIYLTVALQHYQLFANFIQMTIAFFPLDTATPSNHQDVMSLLNEIFDGSHLASTCNALNWRVVFPSAALLDVALSGEFIILLDVTAPKFSTGLWRKLACIRAVYLSNYTFEDLYRSHNRPACSNVARILDTVKALMSPYIATDRKDSKRPVGDIGAGVKEAGNGEHCGVRNLVEMFDGSIEHFVDATAKEVVGTAVSEDDRAALAAVEASSDVAITAEEIDSTIPIDVAMTDKEVDATGKTGDISLEEEIDGEKPLTRNIHSTLTSLVIFHPFLGTLYLNFAIKVPIIAADPLHASPLVDVQLGYCTEQYSTTAGNYNAPSWLSGEKNTSYRLPSHTDEQTRHWRQPVSDNAGRGFMIVKVNGSTLYSQFIFMMNCAYEGLPLTGCRQCRFCERVFTFVQKTHRYEMAVSVKFLVHATTDLEALACRGAALYSTMSNLCIDQCRKPPPPPPPPPPAAPPPPHVIGQLHSRGNSMIDCAIDFFSCDGYITSRTYFHQCNTIVSDMYCAIDFFICDGYIIASIYYHQCTALIYRCNNSNDFFSAVTSTKSSMDPSNFSYEVRRTPYSALPASLTPAPTSPTGRLESFREPLRRHQIHFCGKMFAVGRNVRYATNFLRSVSVSQRRHPQPRYKLAAFHLESVVDFGRGRTSLPNRRNSLNLKVVISECGQMKDNRPEEEGS
ncbi:hypothetical protein PR048_013637 [Dryococelus australis]|uniref:Uncharacterized protein n=1 Tax=Dryococelus australis TaxID=614101 RepID=A0ABQ9HT60_9NEOP|nr:hypothetical protein PR048_013637 [Dryococelus australis]